MENRGRWIVTGLSALVAGGLVVASLSLNSCSLSSFLLDCDARHDGRISPSVAATVLGEYEKYNKLPAVSVDGLSSSERAALVDKGKAAREEAMRSLFAPHALAANTSALEGGMDLVKTRPSSQVYSDYRLVYDQREVTGAVAPLKACVVASVHNEFRYPSGWFMAPSYPLRLQAERASITAPWLLATIYAQGPN